MPTGISAARPKGPMFPTMLIVAGPPGSGKSTAFPVDAFGMDYFNADDQAARLNGYSYLGISRAIRNEVNRQFELIVNDHIRRLTSCAFETTLRSSITFEQAHQARQAGFSVEMHYLALNRFELHLERVKMRADKGGHSAPVRALRDIHESSLRNLPRAIRELDVITVYDNSTWGGTPKIVLRAEKGVIVYKADYPVAWLPFGGI